MRPINSQDLDNSPYQSVNVSGDSRRYDIGLSLLALALSFASLVVSSATLLALFKLIRLISPLLIPAQ